jgi:hypothetical protein
MAGPDVNKVINWLLLATLTNADLDAEFSNIYGHMSAEGTDDYSETTTQMQIQTDPGAQGTESLATNIAGELARLRFTLKRLMGTTYWYDAPDITLSEVNTTVVGASYTPDNRVVSGRSRTDSNQAIFLVPAGSSPQATIKAGGSNPDLSHRIKGTLYTISSDVTLSSLSTAPGSNNTCLVDDALAADEDTTAFLGEQETTLTVDAMGSEIVSLVGQYAAFAINDGADDEYFTAYVKSTTELTNCYRGFFFDSSDNPVPRLPIANNDTITLLKLTYVFIDSSGTANVTYNNPSYAYDTPSGASIGDKWFDLEDEIWMHYNGSAWVDNSETLLGVLAQDDTNCIAGRSLEFHASYDVLNTIGLELKDADEIQLTKPGGKINVAGAVFDFGLIANANWELAGDLESGSEAASTMYYAYVTELGDTILSVHAPFDRRGDLRGFYHPYHTWRCVGYGWNDSGSDFSGVSTADDSSNYTENDVGLRDANGSGSSYTFIRRWATVVENVGVNALLFQSATLGDYFVIRKSSNYIMTYCDAFTASKAVGISLNATAAECAQALTTPIAESKILAIDRSGLADYPVSVSVAVSLKVGDIIRPHHTGGTDSSSYYQFCRIIEVRP